MNRIIPGSRITLGEPLAFGIESMPPPLPDDPLTRAIDDPSPSSAKTSSDNHAAEVEQQISEQIQSRVDESYRAGYVAGQEAARRDLSQTIQRITQDFGEIIQKITSERQRLWHEMEEFAVKLSLGIAGHIVQHAAEGNEQIARLVAQRTINQAMEADIIALRLNPQDLAKLQESKDSFPPKSLGAVEIKSDGRVGRGGCIVETNMGDFDGRLETQIKVIYETLMKEFVAAPSGATAESVSEHLNQSDTPNE